MKPVEGDMQKRLGSIKRVVIKVGTHLLRGEDEGLNAAVLEMLTRQIHEIRNRGIEVILVSSGAVGVGAYVMQMNKPPTALDERQALAAIGQSRLMNHYKNRFRKLGIQVAQVLLTRDNLDERRRYLNVRNTLDTLLEWKILPIINENDTVAVEELKFGDNDQLSAMIAAKIGADLLVLLTDVDGLYDRSPREEGARKIDFVGRIEDAVDLVRPEAGGAFGLGGMRSKLEAAGLAMQAGILTHVTSGHKKNALTDILEGKPGGTWFVPLERRLKGRKRWIAFGKRLCDGRIDVDEGAEEALRDRGKSLLPSGVRKVKGDFKAGDLVRVCGPNRREVARGLVRFSADELEQVKGRKTGEVQALLGRRPNYEVIHRDDMIVFQEGGS
jgi:glutamate 5-kinase